MLIVSPVLDVPHGFTTRLGGVSRGPFAGLNLSWSTGDRFGLVMDNQYRVLGCFNYPPVAALNQIHGNRVHVVSSSGTWEGDGLLTQEPGLLLRVVVADCYPVLLEDPRHNVVGALHAGWRGTLAGILPRALVRMARVFGSQPPEVRIAIGPGIAGSCYQVGPEVAEAFVEQGYAAAVNPDPTDHCRFLLDLLRVLYVQARAAGVPEKQVWQSGVCTHCEPRFFSHRRDHGLTGRMWALVQALRP